MLFNFLWWLRSCQISFENRVTGHTFTASFLVWREHVIRQHGGRPSGWDLRLLWRRRQRFLFNGTWRHVTSMNLPQRSVRQRCLILQPSLVYDPKGSSRWYGTQDTNGVSITIFFRNIHAFLLEGTRLNFPPKRWCQSNATFQIITAVLLRIHIVGRDLWPKDTESQPRILQP